MTRGLIALLLLMTNTVAAYASDWTISIGTGVAYSQSERLVIKMNDGEDILLGDVSFDTKPFQSPPYYLIKIGRFMQESDMGFEFEFIHHKVYADLDSDPHPQVTRLKVTDGYNLVYFNFIDQIAPKWIARLGVGGVIVHPDVIIDGKRTHGGYDLSGYSAQVAIEREMFALEHVAFSVEAKLTYSDASVAIAQGSFDLKNKALHLVAQAKF
ncbi:hypothetical protein BIY21_08975 [Vibrio ponticus]|uniref:Uncharacterized protein n=1 Tax=Vibrio ponticus TaxID=265668 RepID=A0ABX3FN26_9VIBR|nr:hypothetical protein [Vibrio ponticus]OLQ94439.1 hypothetical protein BIY21_08975 [Vibrio ponticus]